MKKDTFKNWLIIILLLVIAGGGILFYIHSRPQAVKPEAAEKLISVAAELPKAEDISIAKKILSAGLRPSAALIFCRI